MAVAQVSNCFYTSVRDVCGSNPARTSSAARIPQKGFCKIGTTFTIGTPLLIQKASYSKKAVSKATSVSIRCEQSAKGGKSLDVWLGRLAMVGFAAAISVEIATGKGLLELLVLCSTLVLLLMLQTTKLTKLSCLR